MSDESKPRQIPVRKWSCPHHDYPVTIGGGYDDEGEHPWEALPQIAALVEQLPADDAARIEFGLCCRDASWVTVGYRDASPFEELLYSMVRYEGHARIINGGPLFAEMLSERKDSYGSVRIPIVLASDEATKDGSEGPG